MIGSVRYCSSERASTYGATSVDVGVIDGRGAPKSVAGFDEVVFEGVVIMPRESVDDGGDVAQGEVAARTGKGNARARG